jgi:hypothetical protein
MKRALGKMVVGNILTTAAIRYRHEPLFIVRAPSAALAFTKSTSVPIGWRTFFWA